MRSDGTIGWLLAIGLAGCGTTHAVRDGASPPATDDAGATEHVREAGEPVVVPAPSCESTCLTTEQIVATVADDETGRVFRAVARRELESLEQLVGRYTCGDATAVYAGTLQATDDRGDHKPPFENGRIDGEVIGTLEVEWPPPWNGHARLLMRSADGNQLLLEQAPLDPDWTECSAVERSDRTVPAHRAGCFGCIPPLPDAPDELMLRPFELNAIVGDWRVSGEGHLLRVDPDDVTLGQLVVIGGASHAFDDFERAPDAWRQTRRGTLEEGIDTTEHGGEEFDTCFAVTEYEITATIPTACPAAYRIGPLRIVDQQTCCERTVWLEDCACSVPYRTERECF